MEAIETRVSSSAVSTSGLAASSLSATRASRPGVRSTRHQRSTAAVGTVRGRRKRFDEAAPRARNRAWALSALAPLRSLTRTTPGRKEGAARRPPGTGAPGTWTARRRETTSVIRPTALLKLKRMTAFRDLERGRSAPSHRAHPIAHQDVGHTSSWRRRVGTRTQGVNLLVTLLVTLRASGHADRTFPARFTPDERGRTRTTGLVSETRTHRPRRRPGGPRPSPAPCGGAAR